MEQLNKQTLILNLHKILLMMMHLVKNLNMLGIK
jgi:hypothetical protein